MAREELNREVRASSYKNILAELPTGYGKTKLALDWLASQIHKQRILVVVPRLVLMDSWRAEFEKWGYERLLLRTTFTTYRSFYKHADTKWDIIVFDEAHHLSDRCLEDYTSFSYRKAILLSATIKADKLEQLQRTFTNLQRVKVTPRQAIQEEVLPDPMVYLIPLYLDYVHPTCEIVRNTKCKKEITIPYKERFKYLKRKEFKLHMKCTQREYYNDISSQIIKMKSKIRDERIRTLYLHKCGERLKWLAHQKTDFVKELLNKIGNTRSLTFCANIEQTEQLGKYCINSKNKDALQHLEMFNEGKINHITACNMLDEGVNLVDCQMGIFANINSSERMQRQRLGRILRHRRPIIIIPYYVNTREDEIVEEMKQDYNPALITVINNISDLKL